MVEDFLERTDTHRSKNHVQWHCNVKVKGIVVDHTDCEEHGHHEHIVPKIKTR